jgi:hypothetical protein
MSRLRRRNITHVHNTYQKASPVKPMILGAAIGMAIFSQYFAWNMYSEVKDMQRVVSEAYHERNEIAQEADTLREQRNRLVDRIERTQSPNALPSTPRNSEDMQANILVPSTDVFRVGNRQIELSWGTSWGSPDCTSGRDEEPRVAVGESDCRLMAVSMGGDSEVVVNVCPGDTPQPEAQTMTSASVK